MPAFIPYLVIPRSLWRGCRGAIRVDLRKSSPKGRGAGFILHKRLEELAKIYNQRPAILFRKSEGYETLTFFQFLDRAKKIGYFLIQNAVKKQENIALFLENQPNWGCVYFGILFSGAVCVPLDVKLTKEELENVSNDASVRIVFTSKTLADKISTLKRALKIILIDSPAEEPSFIKDINIPENFVWPEANLDELCSLVYTSGTVSQPKGVMLAHRNFSANLNSIEKLGFLTDKDNFISMLPLHHIYPFTVNLLAPLFLGARITYTETLASEDIIKCTRDANVTIVTSVPQFFNLLLAGIRKKIKETPILIRIFLTSATQFLWLIRKAIGINLSKLLYKKLHNNFGKGLRFFISGGAKLDPKDATGLMKLGFTILEGYGLTETAPVVSFNKPDDMKIGSIGKPLSDVEVKINDPDNEGVGEILIKGENVFKGYYRRDDLTREAIKDGWFSSGDLGFIDKEGFVYITGRCKEVIVLSSGKNIYPEELEVFYKQSPYIKELCVLESKGLHTLVVPNMEYFTKTRLSDIQGTISMELENLSRKLPSFKRLMGFVISIEGLPRTRLGKIQRYKAKQIYESKIIAQEKRKNKQPPTFELESILKDSLLYKVLTFLSKELKMQVRPDDHLELDLGIDSLRRVELGLNLEKFLGVEFPEDLLTNIFTVGELTAKLEESIKDKPASIDLSKMAYAWKELLSRPPSIEVKEKIKLEPDFINKILTFLFTKLFYFIFFAFCFLRVRGRKNIPKNGPYILCANHTSYLDAFIVVSSLPFGVQLQTFFLGHTNIFELPIFKWSLKLARIIPIDPSVHLLDAMQASAFVSGNSKVACIFPEGQRSIDGNIGEFKNGVGILIKELNVPCVPVYIKGSYEAWPRHKFLPRPYPIEIIFGRSYTKEDLKLIGAKKAPLDTDEYTLITTGLREIMSDLSDAKK